MKEIILFIILVSGAAFLIKKKIPVYLIIIFMTVFTFFYYQIPYYIIPESLSYMLKMNSFQLLLLNIILIFFMGKLFSHTGKLEEIGESIIKVFPTKIALTILPLIVGFFPMPGGALFTLDFVKKISDKNNTGDRVTIYSNYWFRHVWEFIFPVYPGIILYASMLERTPWEIIRIQYPLTIVMIITGYIMLAGATRKQKTLKNQTFTIKNLLIFLSKLWFIFLILIAVIMEFPVAWALSGIILFTWIKTRVNIKTFFNIFKSSLKPGVLMTVYTVYVFQHIIENSPIAENISQLTSSNNLIFPVITIVFPFIIGYLTGITASFVGICFPVLMPFLKDNLSLASVVYTAGFMGVMATPMHLCLSMSVEFIKTSYGPIYKLLYPSITAVMISAWFILMLF
ncbi:MAG: DUF401 family protein [Candidatus Muiribacteriota bacterium]